MAAPTINVNNNAVMQPADMYDRIFMKMEKELEKGSYDTLQLLFKILTSSPTNSLVKQRPDLCTKLVFQIVLPKLNDPKFPEKIKKCFSEVLTALKTHHVFTENRSVEEQVTIVCRDGEVKFNEFLLNFAGTNYFSAALKSEFKEAKMKAFKMADFSTDTILKFKKFIYEGYKYRDAKDITFSELNAFIEIYRFGKLLMAPEFTNQYNFLLTCICSHIKSTEQLTNYLEAISCPEIDEELHKNLSEHAVRAFTGNVKNMAYSIKSKEDFDAFIQAIAPLQGSSDHDQVQLYNELYQLGVDEFCSVLKQIAESVTNWNDLIRLMIASRVLKSLNKEELKVSLQFQGLQNYLKVMRIPCCMSSVPMRICVPYANFQGFKDPKFDLIRKFISGVMIDKPDLENVLLSLSMATEKEKMDIKEVIFADLSGNAFIPELLQLLPDLEFLGLELSYQSEPVFYHSHKENRLFAEFIKILNESASSLQCVHFAKFLYNKTKEEAKLTGLLIDQSELASLEKFPPIIYGDNLHVSIELGQDDDANSKALENLKKLEAFKYYDVKEMTDSVSHNGKTYQTVLLMLKKEFGGCGQILKQNPKY